MSTNEDVIAALVAEGADLSKRRPVRHYVYMPTEIAAASVASKLRDAGYETEVSPSALDDTWLVLASHYVVVSAAAASSIRHFMETLIAEYGGGEYDGWEAGLHGHETIRN